jgi:type VI protein secretion system component Hcp
LPALLCFRLRPATFIRTLEYGASHKREPFLIYELEDVFATSFQFSNSITEAGTVPTESVTFDFKKIKWTYVQYGADGKKEGKVTHEYKVGEKN